MRIALLLLFTLASNWAQAQDRSLASTAQSATAQERLLMEQIDQLAGAGQTSEALSSLKRLVDQSQGRLIEVGGVQRAATLSIQLHVPIVDWAEWRLAAWSKQNADKLSASARTDEEFASRALASISSDLGPRSVTQIIQRYPLADSSTDARLMLCDLYLDRGWTVAARQALDGPRTGLRAWPLGADTTTPAVGLPWVSAWPRVHASKQIQQLLDQSWRAIGSHGHAATDEASNATRLNVLKRLIASTAIDGTENEIKDLSRWAIAMGERLPTAQQRAQLEESIQQANQWFAERSAGMLASPAPSHTFASNNDRNGSNHMVQTRQLNVGSWPKWTRALERMTGQVDRNPASKPPVAESTNGILPYYPLVHDGKIFVHELTRITAFDMATGKSWPPTDPALPLYDSGITAATYFPFGYNLVGAPRGTLTIADNRLYARVGPPVTGWIGRAPTNEHLSLSSLIALDLKRQGSMCPGFPIRLSSDEFPHAEFEGAPSVAGQQVVACLLQRDNVNLRRSVISLDRDTGQLLWRSPVIASGMVSGCEHASLVSHQLLTVSGGRVFVSTNLGAVACLDLEDGHIVWLARYQRAAAATDEAYPRPDRFRYRDLTPCMVVGSQIICAPQDCPEVFALDAASGQLLWSTDAERVDDSNQLLGAYKQSLIVAGDRLYWLDASTGNIAAAFPSAGVGEVNNALPSPRGYGRGMVVGNRVYWPTQNEIYVFDAEQNLESPGRSPAIRERIRLDTRGAEGGNLALSGNGLIIAGPSRLFVFE